MVVIIIKIVGPFLVISNFHSLGWIAAGILGAFTLLTIPFGHASWKFTGPRRTAEIHIMLEHVALVGGMMLTMAMLLN